MAHSVMQHIIVHVVDLDMSNLLMGDAHEVMCLFLNVQQYIVPSEAMSGYCCSFRSHVVCVFPLIRSQCCSFRGHIICVLPKVPV